MKKIFCLWAVVLLSVFIVSEAGAVKQWAARYDGPGHSDDQPAAIAVDGNGDVYVTGGSTGSTTSWDFATIKYGPNGRRKWVRRHDSSFAAVRVEFARAMAVDSQANVYVTGEESTGGVPTNLVTVKYDAGGHKQWAVRYQHDDPVFHRVRAVAVDSAGNVYVTGDLINFPWSSSLVTVKYDKDGHFKWKRQFHEGKHNEPAAIAVDLLGNVYVAGWSSDEDTEKDFVLLKYDAAGVRQWARRYNGPVSDDDGITGLKVVSRLNSRGQVRTDVYVTGYSTGNGTQGDYLTFRYDPAGNSKWLKRYCGPAAYPDVSPVAVGVDDTGNVYVTGSGVSPSEYITVKYNGNGERQWIRRFHMGASQELARAMAVDPAGNVYVTGRSLPPGAGSYDIVTIKYDTDGHLKWTERYNGPSRGDDDPVGIAVDASGNAYVTGRSEGQGTGDDYVTIKYPAN